MDPAAGHAAFPAIAGSGAHMARLDVTTVFLAALETLPDGLAVRIAAEAARRGLDTPGEPAAGPTALRPPQ